MKGNASITIDQLIAVAEARNGYPLTPNQKQAIKHGDGPLAIVAGPGAGKTEVLVLRALRLMCCDQVHPRSIILTTFTEKAARNLQDRIANTHLALTAKHQQLSSIDTSEARIGTLHSICNDVLQEYRFPAYQNVRLLDQAEADLFKFRKLKLEDKHKDALFGLFRATFGNYPRNKIPKWGWVDSFATTSSRAYEDLVDFGAMKAKGGHWLAFAELCEVYEKLLSEEHSSDFTQLLRTFLAFLNSPKGAAFLKGESTPSFERPPVRHVLVDEYQDTNVIQEAIYLSLGREAPHNVCIVGDDDQALYRFRGGSVECMVGFADRCMSQWRQPCTTIYLSENFRSHKDIVKFCNTFIRSFPAMQEKGARIAGKPELISSVDRGSGHPAVSHCRGKTVADCASSFATLVRDIKKHGVVEDYSQCVLLLHSAKESPRNAGPFADALRSHNVPIYNPRSGSFLEAEEVRQFLGAFVSVVDPGLTVASALQSPTILAEIQSWVGAYSQLAKSATSLRSYVEKSASAIQAKDKGDTVAPAFGSILYRILAHDPFVGYQQDFVRDQRLSKLTRWFEAFSAQYGRSLIMSKEEDSQLSGFWLNGLYYGLCGQAVRDGLNDDEDDETIVPRGHFPIMTIHQAKGLEFDFVFVGNLGGTVSPGASHEVEHSLRPFRSNGTRSNHTVDSLAWQDEIRLHYVAYSRAKYALVLLATEAQLRKKGSETASFGGNGGSWVKQDVQLL
ncbi:MAG: ATP-dependent helicase [Planctomycetes bacterium]|nr:ATP-dependent helicase [Planctomycetota bacterium]MCW8134451.1 ATP-dependent helicase [Planctomycetota bacterium]